MGFLFFATLCIMILIGTGSGRYEARENHVYMVNAEWLAAADKFKLIARWGVK